MAAARIEGPLGFAQVDEVLANSDQIVDTGRLDLSAISTIDSAGVSVLLELSRRVQAVGRTLEIHGASPQVRALIKFFRVEPLLRFAD